MFDDISFVPSASPAANPHDIDCTQLLDKFCIEKKIDPPFPHGLV